MKFLPAGPIAAAALSALLSGCTLAPSGPESGATAPMGDTAALRRDADAGEGIRKVRGNLVTESVPETPSGLSERLAAYENVRSHGFLDWTGNGGILIATRFGDTSQIHLVRRPLGARHQLTFFDEPVSSANAKPSGGAFLFARDTGGDEYFQGYYFDRGNGRITRFTQEGTRNGAALWSDDSRLAAWAQTRPGDPDNDIMIADPADPGSVQLVLEGEGAIGPVDWSDGGTHLLLQRYLSIAHSRLYILDLSDSSLTEVNPGAEVSYSGGALLADGSVLTASNLDGEFTDLIRIAADGGITNYTGAYDWDVSDWDVSPDGSQVVFTLNEGGLGTIHLLDLETGEVSPGPALPAGIASGLNFSPDGQQVGFTFNAATSPADAWAFYVDTLALTRWTEAETGGLNAADFIEPTLFTYPNGEGMDIPAFIYRPEGEGPFPVIISIHGGPEAQSRPGFSSTFQYWAKELGLAVVVPNVRGSSGYGKTYVSLDNGLNRKKPVEDIGALLDWIGQQDELDAQKVIVYGGSYGGYMVLASMIDYPDRIAAGIDIVGISDFKTFLQNTEGYRADLRRAEYGDERDPAIAEFFDEISPLRNASRIRSPLFVIQGYNDPRVPYTEAEQILEAVRSNGVPTWFMMAMDEGHGFRRKSNRKAQREAEALFLKEVLGIEAAGP